MAPLSEEEKAAREEEDATTAAEKEERAAALAAAAEAAMKAGNDVMERFDRKQRLAEERARGILQFNHKPMQVRWCKVLNMDL